MQITQTNSSNIIEICGIEFHCRFQYSDTELLFGSYNKKRSKRNPDVFIHDYQWKEWEKTGKPFDQNAEFSLFSGSISDALLPYGYCLVHAAAIRYNGRAYLFTAKPGIGKSTQVKNLIIHYPGEFSVICGDRPVLQIMKNGVVIVHPSPWNGKENWYGAASAPLGGIFCLERGGKTEITPLTPKQAIIPVFKSFISNYDSKETIMQLAKMESSILNYAKVFRYINGGVPASTHYLYQNIFKRISDEKI